MTRTAIGSEICDSNHIIYNILVVLKSYIYLYHRTGYTTVHPQAEQYESLSAFDLDWKSLTALIQVGETILPEKEGTFKSSVFMISLKHSYNTVHLPSLLRSPFSK